MSAIHLFWGLVGTTALQCFTCAYHFLSATIYEMKITFPLPRDDKVHRICLVCTTDDCVPIIKEGRRLYHCTHCNKDYDRSIYITPDVRFWVAEDGELWHESAIVFLRNADGKILFYERTEYPFGLTVPSGHVDTGDTPRKAAATELDEEVGVTGVNLRQLVTIDMLGDTCSAGSDAHKVHVFTGMVDHLDIVMDTHEGHKPEWLTLDELWARNPVPVVREALQYGPLSFEN
jgi:ADP-ribose pyrophosphatase YjhB (NUDIX family)